jgi:hypothetical protein
MDGLPQLNKKYHVEFIGDRKDRGTGDIKVLNIITDAEGYLFDCRVIKGRFQIDYNSMSKTREVGNIICIRPYHTNLTPIN